MLIIDFRPKPDQGCYNFSKTMHGYSETTNTSPALLTNQASGLKTGIIVGLM